MDCALEFSTDFGASHGRRARDAPARWSLAAAKRPVNEGSAADSAPSQEAARTPCAIVGRPLYIRGAFQTYRARAGRAEAQRSGRPANHAPGPGAGAGALRRLVVFELRR